jgi:hypothetical protein
LKKIIDSVMFNFVIKLLILPTKIMNFFNYV